MNTSLDLIRAWKDEDYRESLNAAQLAELGQNPAGAVELTDEELDSVDGGLITFTTVTISITLSYLVYCVTW